MNKDIKVIPFPKQLNTNYKTFIFLKNASKFIINNPKNDIILDLSNTKFFSTNLLAVMGFWFGRAEKSNQDLHVVLPNKKVFSGEKSIQAIFNFFATDKRAFFKPRQISEEKTRETEDILLKYLKNLKLLEYDLVKTIISEIFVNIKMHTEQQVGFFSGDYSVQNNEIVISIVNEEYSIPDQLRIKRGMIFGEDIEAIIWTLKKSNSTRDKSESGGLGLYLLRKYISQIGGKVSIVSGTSYIELDESCYNENNENEIIINDYYLLDEKFNGTMITLHVPYRKNTDQIIEDAIRMVNINLLDILRD